MHLYLKNTFALGRFYEKSKHIPVIYEIYDSDEKILRGKTYAYL